MNVFITGIRGFLGAALAQDLRARGCTVRGSSHRQAAADAIHICNAATPPQPAWFRGCELVIHCAYDAAPGASAANLRLTQAVHDAAAAAGVPRQVFVSSHSARPDAHGEYGRQKYVLEHFFLEHGQLVLRPGLIVGPGGLFAALRRQVLALPLLVLPAPDRLPVFYIALPDLLDATWRIVTGTERGAFNLFDPDPPSLRQFTIAIARAAGKRKLILGLPLPLIDLVLGAGARLNAAASPAMARLFTARQNIREPHYHRSDLPRFVAHSLPLAAALAAG